MNGLTSSEMRRLGEIRELAKRDIPRAKIEASRWLRDGGARRRVIRRVACRTIYGLHAHFKPPPG